MRRWFAALALLLSLSLPTAVQAHALDQAQNPVTIQSLEIDIWPEYDRPGVLIIYRVTLSPQVKLPAEVTLRIPSVAGQPSAVAEQTDNGLFNIQFNNAGTDGSNQLIRFTTTLPQLQIEYYDPGLTKNGATHNYSYHWPGDYPVQDMLIKVQQPRTATGMKLAPKTGSSAQEGDGLTYFSVPVGKVNGGETFEINLTYQKSDDNLTQPAAFEQVTPIGAPAQGTSGQVTLDQVLPWVLGGLGLVLIAGGVFWYLRTGKEPAAREKRHASRRSQTAPMASSAAAAAEAEEAGIFCHQCGKKASPTDVFCRSCGAKLRR